MARRDARRRSRASRATDRLRTRGAPSPPAPSRRRRCRRRSRGPARRTAATGGAHRPRTVREPRRREWRRNAPRPGRTRASSSPVRYGHGIHREPWMIPVVTPDEMRAIDAAAPEPVEVLIDRAGAAVARAAIAMLDGSYGRRVVVIAGKGNNGADGRAAGRLLERRGVRVTALDASDAPGRVPPCDLVIDAAYGTGFRGAWQPPDTGGAPVLAVDIPSGVDGTTGAVHSGVLTAVRTVTFAAL